MDAVKTINYIISIVFILCYSYQFMYMLVPYIIKDRPRKPVKPHRYYMDNFAFPKASTI